MADPKGKQGDKGEAVKTEPPKIDQPKTIGLGVRLMPTGDSDQPRVANYTSVTLAPGMVFLDFGFFEPAMLAALPRVAQEGGKLPESINGRLATRVAMSYDTLANLHQQLGNALQAARAPKST
jgi:hypothetical protein